MPEKLKNEVNQKVTLLGSLPVHPSISSVLQRLRFHPEINITIEEIENLIQQAVQQARPRALYKISRVTAGNSSSLKIDGQEFKNPLLQVNLNHVESVFPFLVTSGQYPQLLFAGDPGRIYTLNLIEELLLAESVNYLRRYIIQNHHLDYLWQLMPGETQAWPVSGRKDLMSLLGDSAELAGIKLKDDSGFDPANTTCGILYFASLELEACQVCAQEPCMGRRAPYSQELAEKYFDRARRPCGCFKKAS